jgi:hypothetical protein
VGDSVLAVGDVQMTLVGRDTPSDKAIRLDSASGKRTSCVLHDFGFRFGGPSLGHFWDRSGAKLTACDVLRFDIDEFGFTSEPSGGRYIAFSGTIPLGGGADTTPATDAAFTTTDEKEGGGRLAFRFYRVLGKFSGPPEAPDTLIAGIGLSFRLQRLKLTASARSASASRTTATAIARSAWRCRCGSAPPPRNWSQAATCSTARSPGRSTTSPIGSWGRRSARPIGAVTLRNVRALGAMNMAPEVGPADVGNAQPMPLLDSYRSHGESLELAPSRNLTSNGSGPVDDSFAVGGSFIVELCAQLAVHLDAFGLYTQTPGGSRVLVALALIAFGSEKPVAFGALEIDGDRWSVLIGLSIGTSNVLPAGAVPRARAAVERPALRDEQAGHARHRAHQRHQQLARAAHQRRSVGVPGRAVRGRLPRERRGSRGPARVRPARRRHRRDARPRHRRDRLPHDARPNRGRLANRVERVGFIAYFEAGARFDVFFIFDFGASFRVEWDYLGPDPAYRRGLHRGQDPHAMVAAGRHLPLEQDDPQPQLEEKRVLGTPVIESAAQAMAKTPACGAPIKGDEIELT